MDFTFILYQFYTCLKQPYIKLETSIPVFYLTVVCADRNNKSCQSLKTLRPEKSQNIGRCHHLAHNGKL
jgi:hypothetical protein